MKKTQYTFIPSSQSPVPSPQSLTSTSDSEIKDARSLLASPLLPKGEANAKGEDSLPLRYRIAIEGIVMKILRTRKIYIVYK
ncbi:hypothetical protein [Nostoc sp.]|uniref:hypothetical protein n=1 Tax=Nostoc sp. TaxID=1180 RepID=UPI002FEFA9C0